LDAAEAPSFEWPAKDLDPAAVFDRVWARFLLQEAVTRLRGQYTQCDKENAFRIFETYALAKGDPPSYRELALRFQVTEHTVRGILRRLRSEVRGLVRDRIRNTLQNPAEVDAEMLHLYGSEGAWS